MLLISTGNKNLGSKTTKEKEQQANNIVELRTAGKCFKCKEPWIPGHAKISKGKQLFSVIVIQDEDGQEKVQIVDEIEDKETETFQDAVEKQIHSLKVSMHASQGTSLATTFTLRVKMGNAAATALVDTGSDAS